jgi:drug/metabolite transporter (DMT)-like permease
MDDAFKGQSSYTSFTKKVNFFTNPFAISFCGIFFLVFKSFYAQVLFIVCDLLFGCTPSYNIFQNRLEPFTLVHISNLPYYFCTWQLLERVNFMKTSTHQTSKLSYFGSLKMAICWILLHDESFDASFKHCNF